MDTVTDDRGAPVILHEPLPPKPTLNTWSVAMFGEKETAARGMTRDFPSRWGTPAGSRFSDERCAWIQTNIEADNADPVRLAQRARSARLRLMVDEGEGLADLIRPEGGGDDDASA